MAARDVRERAEAKSLAYEFFPSFLRSRERAVGLDAWMKGRQYQYSDTAGLDPDDEMYGRAYAPDRETQNTEYENLRGLAPNNFAGLIVTSLAQTCHMEGISRGDSNDTLDIWETFQRNQWASRQSALYRSAIGHGVAYGVVLPGEDPISGGALARMRGKSAKRMAAFYDDEDDEWAEFAIEATKKYKSRSIEKIEEGWDVRIWNSKGIHLLECKGDGTERLDWKYVGKIEHFMPVTPVARLANRLDLDGHTMGEIEPVLPILRRLDQGLFDRLINQRFGAWQIRYIAGMAKPKPGVDAEEIKMKLRVDDLLVSTDPTTKFGVLPGGPIDGQIAVTDADLRLLSAVTQTPPHHLLGMSANLQAESLAAASEGLKRKSFEFRNNAGDFNTQMARLAGLAQKDRDLASAWDLHARWKNTDTVSLSQAADALAKFAADVHVPLEMVWEMMPDWSDVDVERAKRLVEDGTIETLLAQLMENDQEATGGNPDQRAGAAE